MAALSRYLNDPEFRAMARKKEELGREHLPPWMKGMTAFATPKTVRLGMYEVMTLPLFIDVPHHPCRRPSLAGCGPRRPRFLPGRSRLQRSGRPPWRGGAAKQWARLAKRRSGVGMGAAAG